MTPTPPPRPSSLDDLGFEPQEPVMWFSPTELLQSAKKLAISRAFGDYADKRELIGTLPDQGIRDHSGARDLWFDYVSDLGDGFDATYSIASLLTAPKLDLADPVTGAAEPTRRGRLLVMGGDEVYPAASIENYEDRTIGPYRAALPWRESDPPDLFAVPGNHDWYDGLTAWMRMFAQGKRIGGWQTHQTRSYFAVALPHRWWLWGLDVQFDSYIDAPQLEYFRRVATEAVRAGDQIILCSATPEWVNSHRNDPESYRNLDYFERQIVVPSGAAVRVAIGGDAHHYAHYVSDVGDFHRFTAGGGGAYLSATHGLPDRLALPPEASTDRHKTTPAVPFRRVAEFPDAATSRRLGRGVWRLPRSNPSFAGVVGGAYAFYAWAAVSVAARSGAAATPAELWRAYTAAARDLGPTDVALGVVGRPLSLVVSLVIAASLFGLTKRGGSRRIVAGAGHVVVQTVVMIALLSSVFALVGRWPGAVALIVGVAGSFAVGAVAGSLVLAAYLSFGDALGRNVNEQFSSMHIEDHKSFLRLHVGADGALTIYPIGLRQVVHRWRVDEHGGPEDPWLVPDGEPLAAELVETPIRIEHGGPR